MTVKELIGLLENNGGVTKTVVYENMKDIEVKDITYNSKAATENSVFFVKGANFKVEYIEDAIARGAILVVAEKEYDIQNAGLVVVPNIRHAMVVCAEEFFGKAYSKIKMVGLTGTKGKTTTATYIHNILNLEKGERTALLSTIETYTGKRCEESHLSTPEAIELQRYIAESVESDLEYLVMEVSSQATKTERILNTEYDIGMFLNISEDHISPAEHPNFNDYLNSKLEFLKKCKTVIVNYETDYLEAVLDAAKDAEKLVTFGPGELKDRVDVYYTNVHKENEYLVFDIVDNGDKATFKTRMMGDFNVQNATAAILTARELKVKEDNILKGIEMTTVSGRMNVFNGNNKTVIVDYAHNKLSFEKFFEAVKKDYPNSEIVALFGAPGGKAYGRRQAMSEVASRYADKIYLTADDPQFEVVRDICNELATYITVPYEIIEDRKQAIEYAFNNMKANGVLCLLAKGEDRYQQVKGKLEEYESDVDIAKEITKEG